VAATRCGGPGRGLVMNKKRLPVPSTPSQPRPRPKSKKGREGHLGRKEASQMSKGEKVSSQAQLEKTARRRTAEVRMAILY